MLNKILRVLALFACFQALYAQDVEISGDKIEYIRKKGSEAAILKGNAKVVQQDTTITADRIKLNGTKKEYAQCFNNVKIKEAKKQIELTGDYAEYYSKDKYSKVSKKPKLEFKQDNTTITAALMERFENEQRATAKGDVKIKKNDLDTESEMATYYENEEKIELTGKPVLLVKNDKYNANTMVFFYKENRMLMYGNVKATISLETNKNYDFMKQEKK